VSTSIYGSSYPRRISVLEKIPATSPPTVQTAKRCHVWLFERLERLVEMLSGPVFTARARKAQTLASRWERIVLITPQSFEYFLTRTARL